jgi:hypothetical protein
MGNYGGHMGKYGGHMGKYDGNMGISRLLHFRTYGKIWRTYGKICRTYGKIRRTYGKIWRTYGKIWRTCERFDVVSLDMVLFAILSIILSTGGSHMSAIFSHMSE